MKPDTLIPCFLVTLIVLLLAPTISVEAQNVSIATGTYDYVVPRSESRAVAEATACNFARDSAVLKVFPQQLNSEVQTWFENGKVSVRAFNTTELIGEWLGDIKPPELSVISTDPMILRCKVKGRVREKPTNGAEIHVKTLYCPSPACETEQFSEGQSLYLQLTSSKSGYISVFLDDMDKVFQLLPYAAERESGVSQTKLSRNLPQLFFSRADALEAQRHLVDEIELFTEKPGVELSSLVILFSEQPFNSPLMAPTGNADYFDAQKYVGYTMPDSSPSVSFNNWLLRLRQTNPELQAVRKMITIRR